MSFSNLDVVSRADVFPYPTTDLEAFINIHQDFYVFLWEDDSGSVPIGYMRRDVVDALQQVPEHIRGPIEVDDNTQTVTAFTTLPTEPERTARISRVVEYWRDAKIFSVLRGWRNEPWPVYGRDGELLYSIERAAVRLFGAIHYGISLITYFYTPEGDMRIWVPKRAATKSTFPGMLDITVGGGLKTGENPFECTVREADEEASLPAALVRERARLGSVLSFMYITDAKAGGEVGLVCPEYGWSYDMELPRGVVPVPRDGEVEAFQLMTVDDVRRGLADGAYKPNSGAILLDFLIRHGQLTREEEPLVDEIQTRVRRDLMFPGPLM